MTPSSVLNLYRLSVLAIALAVGVSGQGVEAASACSALFSATRVFGSAVNDIDPGWRLSNRDETKISAAQKKQVESIGASWDSAKINERRLPLPIAMLRDQTSFSKRNKFPENLPRSDILKGKIIRPGEADGLNVKNMLVRPSNGEMKLPQEAEQFREVIEAAMAFDRQVNPNSESFNIYISTSQGEVSAMQGQRRMGAHTDGFQEHDVTYNEARIIDHTYIVSDSVPTEFFNQPFEVGKRSGNEALKFFDETANNGAVVRLQPYVIALMDAFTVHRVGLAQKTTQRTFIKVTFSLERFNREGNTLNPLVDYSGWKWAPREASRNSTSADLP